MAHSDYLRWDVDDRVKEAALAAYENECCPQCGIHKGTWDPAFGGDVRRPKVVPQWRFCRPCKLKADAEAEGPPDGKDATGWHLEWSEAHYDD